MNKKLVLHSMNQLKNRMNQFSLVEKQLKIEGRKVQKQEQEESGRCLLACTI